MDMKNKLDVAAGDDTAKRNCEDCRSSNAAQLFLSPLVTDAERDFKIESRRSRKLRFIKSSAPL